MSHRRPVARINRPCAPTAPPAPRRRGLRIGLLGGSFDPAHAGHLTISLEALKRLRLDRVWWLVSPHNPLKAGRAMPSLASRVEQARQVARHPRVVVTGLEQRLGTRYTIDTLRHLQRDGQTRFVWLIGADNLAQMPRWRHWKALVNRVPIAVFDREPYSYRALAGKAAHAFAAARWSERASATLADAAPPAWAFLRLRRHQASSTAIRCARRAGRSQAGDEEEAS